MKIFGFWFNGFEIIGFGFRNGFWGLTESGLDWAFFILLGFDFSKFSSDAGFGGIRTLRGPLQTADLRKPSIFYLFFN